MTRRNHDHLERPTQTSRDDIIAAGGIIRRFVNDDDLELGCIYREYGGDWTFPHGQINEGESLNQAALREVLEETGFRCSIICVAGVTHYTQGRARPMTVNYFLMSIDESELAPDCEAHNFEWLALAQVRNRLTWDRDKDLLDLVTQLPELHSSDL